MSLRFMEQAVVIVPAMLRDEFLPARCNTATSF